MMSSSSPTYPASTGVTDSPFDPQCGLYASAILCTLNDQRKSPGTAPGAPLSLCDVIVKCGVQSSPAHSAVLAAASGFFEKIIRRVSLATPLPSLPPVLLEVDHLFEGVEHLFEDILTFLYLGAQGPALNEEVVRSLAAKLDLRAWKRARRSEDKKAPVQAEERAKKSSTGTKESCEGFSDDCKMDISFCRKCDLLFISKEEFMAHRMVDCTRKFTCKTCGSMFTRVQSLLEHLAEVRHGETICSVCLLALSSSLEMEAHLARHLEQKDKPYFCLKCESRFASRNALSQHLPKHSPETPFVCQICSKGFKWKHALTSHMNVHSAEKKYLCQDCGFATSHSSVLKHHHKIHTGQTLKCSFPSCTFETVRKQNLIQHQLTHSKEKAHQCEVCGKSFSLVKNMRRHLRQHDGKAERHRCRVVGCDFSSLRSDKFVQHVRKHQQAGELDQGLAGGPSAVSTTTAISSASAASSSAAPTPLRNVLDAVNPPNKTVVEGQAATEMDDPSSSLSLLMASSSEATRKEVMDTAALVLNDLKLPGSSGGTSSDLAMVVGRDLDLLAAVAAAPAANQPGRDH